MKKLIALCVVLLVVFALTACVSVPVERKFPSAPPELMASCPELVSVDANTTKLSTVVDSIVTNYSLYQSCDAKTQAWIEWYNTQKKIFETVK